MRPWQAILVVAGVTGLVATVVLAVGLQAFRASHHNP
jgi:hypothetical protein